MKKWLGILALGAVFLLTGCNSYVTSEDLKANDWLVEATKDDEEGTPDMIVSFSNHVMTIKADTTSIESTAENEWEALGEEIGKQLFSQMNITYEYELDKDELKLQYTEDTSKEAYYKVTQEDKNIILTPDKEKNDEDDSDKKMVLKPYKKSKTESSSTSSTTSSSTVETTTSTSEENEVASVDDYIEKFEDKSLVVYNKRKMTKDDFGMAPMTAKDATIFSLIESDNEDEQKNARILSFDNLDDLNATKTYYDDLGKDSAMLFSYTAIDEENLVLMQFNGSLDQSLVEQYTDTVSLKLTEPPFETSISSSEASLTTESFSTEESSTEMFSTSESSEAAADEDAEEQTLNNQTGTDQADTTQDNGTITNADVSVTNADGSVTYADGTTMNADGSITNADGTTTNADGSITNADGSVTNPDGSVTNADGTTTNADGTIMNVDDTTTNADGTDQAQTGASTITALAGEGPNQIAARAGISVETLYELNGIDPDNFMLAPGQELRIR